MKIRRVNFYGGANTGKSTIAPEIYAKFKRKGLSVELAREVIKNDVYKGMPPPKDFDQVRVFGEAMDQELQPLRAGVRCVITDSPLLLSAIYSRSLDFPSFVFNVLADEFEKYYPSINIFLDRAGLKFDPSGRYGTEDDAITVDKLILYELERLGLDYYVMPSKDSETIYKLVEETVFGGDLFTSPTDWKNTSFFRGKR
jgi:hypothetical protein